MGDRASVVNVLPISFPPPKSEPFEGPGAYVGGEEGEGRWLKGRRRGRGAILGTEEGGPTFCRTKGAPLACQLRPEPGRELWGQAGPSSDLQQGWDRHLPRFLRKIRISSKLLNFSSSSSSSSISLSSGVSSAKPHPSQGCTRPHVQSVV